MYKAAKGVEAATFARLGGGRHAKRGQARPTQPAIPTLMASSAIHVTRGGRVRHAAAARRADTHAQVAALFSLRQCVRCRAGPTQAPRSRRPRQTTPILPTPETYLLRCAALRAASSCTRMLRLMRTTRVTTRLLEKRLQVSCLDVWAEPDSTYFRVWFANPDELSLIANR